MKKVAILVIIIIAISLLLVTVLLCDSRDDIQAIRKAVKKNTAYKPGQEVKWFKVHVTDNTTKKDKVRIKVPVALIEYFIDCASEKDLKIKRDDCQVNLKELFQDLKKLGPMSVIEVYEEEVTLKVWFE